MAEIFISYKSERRKAAEHLATILRCHGYTVWFDYSLVKGRDFGLQIDAKVREAKALVVLWCTKAVGSRWVAEEVDFAHDLGILIPVKIEPCELPVGFRRQDYIDLSNWDGAPRSPELDKLIDALEERIGRDASFDRKALGEYEATWRRFGAPSLRSFALETPLEAVQTRSDLEPPAGNGASLLALAAQEWPAVRDSRDAARLARFERHFAGTYYAGEAQVLREELEAEAAAQAERRARGLAEPPGGLDALHARLDQIREAETEAGTVLEAEAKRRAWGERANAGTPVRTGTSMRGQPINPGSGESFWDAPFAPEMVVIPAGRFLMGSKDGEGLDGERPQHLVTIPKPFAVGRHAVTFDEWDACLAAKGTSHNPGDQGWGRGRRPVINVSWNDAKAYAAWLSKETGQLYRLLSEAEWEYCCRAGTTTAYSTGDSLTKKQAQFSEGSAGSAGKTVEVGSFPPNAFGLHDMHGNVWEWVEDCWNGSYKDKPPALLQNGGAWTAGDCSSHVLRGGSWYDVPGSARASYRFRGRAVVRGIIGFRLARPLTS